MAIQNSDAKIFQAGKSFGRSFSSFGRYAKDIDEGRLYERLMKLGNSLIEAPVTSDLEPIFKIEREIATKVAEFQHAKSEAALLKRFERTSEKLLRYAEKLENGASLLERMQAASNLDISKVQDLQPLFALCAEVSTVVETFENDKILGLVLKSHNGWLVTRNGEPARFAEAYKTNPVFNKVVVWVGNKPLANADYRAFKAWRDAGYKLLKGELDHPWGMCSCGQKKLMPWKNKSGEWVPNSLCRDCYASEQNTSTYSGAGKKSGKKVLEFRLEPLSAEEIEANRVAARALNEANRLAKKNRRRQGAEASAGASQQLDRNNMEGFRHSIRKQEKEERKQGGHPGEKGKGKGKKAGFSKKKASPEAK